ncbi:probable aspartic protease At2g35615 [Cynara cardunculus var. scolymus]|uniref:Aspartic peptidase n=1 Tax=Cynara cardunculus var. scolymus TaxID=59895 RepID=A0A103XHS2_CYNCS|nr:probable aspartic protease At2g35615 [Cynara cardunculus var. scolymus]KVH90996.1 Aspartic peptidase [Cynara cardunculus var. scolymus]
MTIFSLALGITLAILYSGGCSTAINISAAAADATFSIDLIHRDSIKSPFYDHGITFSQRLGRALQRSFDKARCLKPSSSTYQTQISPDWGEYLMNIFIGNPSHQILAIADTGSDLTWIQCRPCTQCYKHTGSIFDPKSSSTYKALGCKSEACRDPSFLETNCSSTKTCQYTTSYSDGTYSIGDVATETIKIGGRTIQDIVFGCSFRNGGISHETSSGVVGLGGGDFSLVSQLRTLVAPKFSYCLIPYPVNDDLSKLSSKLVFGDIISFGSQVVSTPLVPKWPRMFYYVTLEGISVSDIRLKYSDFSNPTKRMHKGNMILDSGATLTTLHDKLYHKVEAAIKENLKNVRRVEDPQKILSLCYVAKEVKYAPKITMHFEGADVLLLRHNVFVPVGEQVICLAMVPTSDVAIFGNIAQGNLLIGYDLENKRVSFQRTDCTRLKV